MMPLARKVLLLPRVSVSPWLAGLSHFLFFVSFYSSGLASSARTIIEPALTRTATAKTTHPLNAYVKGFAFISQVPVFVYFCEPTQPAKASTKAQTKGVH